MLSLVYILQQMHFPDVTVRVVSPWNAAGMVAETNLTAFSWVWSTVVNWNLTKQEGVLSVATALISPSPVLCQTLVHRRRWGESGYGK